MALDLQSQRSALGTAWSSGSAGDREISGPDACDQGVGDDLIQMFLAGGDMETGASWCSGAFVEVSDGLRRTTVELTVPRSVPHYVRWLREARWTWIELAAV